jgi:hypothetical protein
VAVTKEGSNIRIINEPVQGSPVFLVETGENPTPRETRNIPKWLDQPFKSKSLQLPT